MKSVLTLNQRSALNMNRLIESTLLRSPSAVTQSSSNPSTKELLQLPQRLAVTTACVCVSLLCVSHCSVCVSLLCVSLCCCVSVFLCLCVLVSLCCCVSAFLCLLIDMLLIDTSVISCQQSLHGNTLCPQLCCVSSLSMLHTLCLMDCQNTTSYLVLLDPTHRHTPSKHHKLSSAPSTHTQTYTRKTPQTI